jgi:hypothetical protein
MKNESAWLAERIRGALKETKSLTVPTCLTQRNEMNFGLELERNVFSVDIFNLVSEENFLCLNNVSRRHLGKKWI